MQPAHAAVLSPDNTRIVPANFPPASAAQLRGTLLIVYGSSPEPNFSNKLRPLAEKLSLLGLRVITFDYRSNVDGADFLSFGMHDRIEDAKEGIRQMKQFGEPPFSILGLDMGGHIAVRAAAETDEDICFQNIILISPEAYPEAATRPGVLFGAGEGGFREIITNQPNSLMTSDACKATTKIDARFLLIRYRHDTPRSKVVTDAYRSSFGKSHNERTPKYDHKLAEIFDTPDGMLTNPKKVGRILEEIDIFTALRTTVKR